ncbi:hypothetical protein LH392_09645 [Corynebacterium uberis]|nr:MULTISPECIES: hypothetical protein [Corynebacterium]MCZ9310224.1 hypothetical protein [Corynebacterium sp. c6VSa_13]UDL74813.1 hypothetical protein LH391_00175 [Corynebacterium uberis]UDL76998.1 hypothetical protein LH393_09230 [Corynebacterium uberis]UDL79208.1 hypothetical protein LH394_09215 [Corynebacterium uberis]UDL81414.1 hypothetical protein LH392_09645 [Corynebacterium uberis]
MVAVSIALAWWQWTRYKSGTGTFQNLGYALQWPLIGGFFVFAYRKYLEYENLMIDAENSADDPDFLFELDQKKFDAADAPREIDADFLPQRPQVDIEEFNALNTPRRGDTDVAGLDGNPRTPRKDT